ncbi:hypothetical protein [Nonomuraea ferruginea]|uniref:Uncharacterized protein n=1 Tax=Nonomuraea ferruginea TaxID=46174 RepID=A0ABT4T230_9ACTN|nr:hypothetical protein [Nonomuraea ferruginea]MDA0643573.1 hypothetical protein [Nonomuraea ferruginea]
MLGPEQGLAFGGLHLFFLCRQRAGDVLQRLLLCLDAEQQHGNAAGGHGRRSDEEPDRSAKWYASAEDGRRYAEAFDKEDRDDLGRRTPLVGLLPLRLIRALRRRRKT